MVRYGTGRTLVGIDSTQTEFDVLGETGGAKSHNHLIPLGFDEGGHLYAYANSNKWPAYESSVFTGSRWFKQALMTYSDSAAMRISYTSTTTILSSYIVVYMYKRVS